MDVTVLTRTRGRPEYFKQCVTSLERQTYRRIEHLVITNGSADYVSGHKVIFLPFDVAANDMLNLVFPTIKTEWFMVLDDDVVLPNKYLFEDVLTYFSNRDVIFWRVQRDGQALPTALPVGNVQVGWVDHGTFLAKTEAVLSTGAKWEGYRGHDFRFIAAWYPKLANRIWLNTIGLIHPDNGNVFAVDAKPRNPVNYNDQRLGIKTEWNFE